MLQFLTPHDVSTLAPALSDQQLPGCVLTVARRDEILVWLIGEIDPSVGPDLLRIARHGLPAAPRLVIDVSRVTFCDSTLLRFLSEVGGVMQVVIRRPSRLVVELLSASGLLRQVLVQAAQTST